MAIVTGERAKIKILEEMGLSPFVAFHFTHTTNLGICDGFVQLKAGSVQIGTFHSNRNRLMAFIEPA